MGFLELVRGEWNFLVKSRGISRGECFFLTAAPRYGLSHQQEKNYANLPHM
jgi:hypothetical protein